MKAGFDSLSFIVYRVARSEKRNDYNIYHKQG